MMCRYLVNNARLMLSCSLLLPVNAPVRNAVKLPRGSLEGAQDFHALWLASFRSIFFWCVWVPWGHKCTFGNLQLAMFVLFELLLGLLDCLLILPEPPLYFR